MAFLFFTNPTKTSYKPSTVLQILLTALHLPTKSPSLFFPLLLISLLSSSSLLLYSSKTITPILQHLYSNLHILFKDPRGPVPPNLFNDIQKDIKDFAYLAALITPIYSLISLLLTVASVYTYALAYTNQANSLTPKTLMVRVSRRSYQTLVTCMYHVLFCIGYVVVSGAVVGTAMMITSKYDSFALVVNTSTGLMTFAVLLFLYLLTRASMSVVIAVVEETWGIGALSWSVELFIGNKQRGTLLSLILMSVRSAIYGALGMVITPRPPKPEEEQTKLIMLGAAFVAAWELYSLAAYTVFYYECRKSHGLENVAVVEEQGFVYSSLPADATAVKANSKIYI